MGEENAFVATYIKKLKENGIQVGVITNHNKFDAGEFNALRKKALKEEILLLPGVELSVGDGSNGVHCLAVYSDEWISGEGSFINDFLTTCFAGKAPTEYECKHGRSKFGILDTIQKLEEFKKDYFLIFAHVEQANGLWSALDGGRLTELGSEPVFRQRVLGFQKVRTIDKPNGKSRTTVQGWLKNSYPAEVEGSDCKSMDEIGKGKPCYLKIGEFSFESVKFALMNHQARVGIGPQANTQSHIVSISYEGGLLAGQTLHFSPELNTLIGIRGSGKSSIIESLRYALDIPFSDHAEDGEYKRELIPYLLKSGGTVTVKVVDRHGMNYVIRRILGQSPEVFVDGLLRPGLSIRDTIVHRPVYFGQKDLSRSGEGFERDLVEKLLGDHLVEIRRKVEDAKQRVRSVAVEFLRMSDLDDEIQEQERRLTDLEHRMGLYRKYSLEEKLQKQLDFIQDEKWIQNSERIAHSYIEGMERFIADYEDELSNQYRYQSKQNEAFFVPILESYHRILHTVDILKTLLENAKSGAQYLHNGGLEFSTLKTGQQEEFAQVNRTLAEELRSSGTQSIRSEEFKEIHVTLDIVNRQLEELKKQKAREIKVRDAFMLELSALENLWHEEFMLTQTLLDKVNENHSSLRLLVEYKGDRPSYLQLLKSVMKGSNLREQDLIEATKTYPDMVTIWKGILGGNGEGVLKKTVFQDYFLKSLADLVTYQVPNRFTIAYQGKELKNHSMGQRASALILFILSQGENDVIMIDQPEDDLDNQTIYADVIRLIERIKKSTQFIFATHNPNIPVLGDAEQVMACSFSDGRIHVKAGGIDSREMQQSIVDIMEGGKDAIDRRKEIYSLWTLQS